MTILQEPLLITSAPDDIQLVLGIFFAIAVAILFSLALEDGVYPSVCNCCKKFLEDLVRVRRRQRRWHSYAFGGGRFAL
jgi:hypothetical protein